MTRTIGIFAISLLALGIGTAAQAKTAFDHELTLSCPLNKSSVKGNIRYYALDLGLSYTHAKYEDDDRRIGEKPKLLAPAAVLAKQNKALAEFTKVLDECQSENRWTDDEKGYARKHWIAHSAYSQARYYLGSPPEDVLLKRYKSLTPTQINDIRTTHMGSSGLLDKVVSDMVTAKWEYKGDYNYASPYHRQLIADAYGQHVVEDVYADLFKKSAAKRFPQKEANTAPPPQKEDPEMSLLCPGKRMFFLGDLYTDFALKLVQVQVKAKDGKGNASEAEIDRRIAAADTVIGKNIDKCAAEFGWNEVAKKVARNFVQAETASLLLGEAFGDQGVNMNDIVAEAKKLNEDQIQALMNGKFEQSGSLDVVIGKLKARGIKLDYADRIVRSNIHDALGTWLVQRLMINKFSDIARGGFRNEL